MSEQIPAGLYGRVINRINYEHRLLGLKRRLAGYSLSLGLFLAIAVLLLTRLRADATASGLTQFGALLFSNFRLVLANFSDFALSLVESIPLWSSVLVLLAATTVWVIGQRTWATWQQLRRLPTLQLK